MGWKARIAAKVANIAKAVTLIGVAAFAVCVKDCAVFSWLSLKG
jgi:hypothetical protein